MKVRDYYVTPKSNRVMRFLWKAAGGDRYLLERATYSDQIKYMCLGGIVFATGAMAGLAGGYAFYTIFSPRGSAIDTVKQKFVEQANLAKELQAQAIGTIDTLKEHFRILPKIDSTQLKTITEQATHSYNTQLITITLLSILFGIIWGLIIFNIDRFIVTSTGKGDGTEAITWAEFKGAIPRIIMGAIIALTISKPVEIRMFKTEIDAALHEKQIQQEQKYKAEIDSVFNSEIKKKEDIIRERLNRISQLESISDKRKADIAYETANGDCKSKCEEYKKQLAANEAEITSLKSDPEYIKVKEELNSIENNRNVELSKSKTVAYSLDGLLQRIKLAHEIAGWVISLFITLLFMAIELTPVFFKLMLIKTPYDYLAENRDELIKAENGIEVRYDYYKDKVLQERHLIINHEADKMIYEKIKVTDIQKELTDYAVEKYKVREKKNIEDNLDDYIKNIGKEESENYETEISKYEQAQRKKIDKELIDYKLTQYKVKEVKKIDENTNDYLKGTADDSKPNTDEKEENPKPNDENKNSDNDNNVGNNEPSNS